MWHQKWCQFQPPLVDSASSPRVNQNQSFQSIRFLRVNWRPIFEEGVVGWNLVNFGKYLNNIPIHFFAWLLTSHMSLSYVLLETIILNNKNVCFYFLAGGSLLSIYFLIWRISFWELRFILTVSLKSNKFNSPSENEQ